MLSGFEGVAGRSSLHHHKLITVTHLPTLTCTNLSSTTLHCTTLHYTMSHHTTLHQKLITQLPALTYDQLHYITPHYTTLHEKTITQLPSLTYDQLYHTIPHYIIPHNTTLNCAAQTNHPPAFNHLWSTTQHSSSPACAQASAWEWAASSSPILLHCTLSWCIAFEF